MYVESRCDTYQTFTRDRLTKQGLMIMVSNDV